VTVEFISLYSFIQIAVANQQPIFLPRDAMLSAAYVVMWCLSVRPSVRVSVTFVDSVKTNKLIFKSFHHPVETPFWFFRTKRHGNI